ncbi:MAG TPA: flap endonuclease-1 [Candidatus Woesearchaeota archaeon]|nr:flap endonuclease-1 [Candidatus Woesearchaeota archaeon]
MGTKLKELASSREIESSELSGKVIAIDAFNFLYQFLTIIRQYDGSPLMDSKGRVTSHLSGLFFRTANFLEQGIKPVYVFDGKSPDLKRSEKEKRSKAKEEAEKKLMEAREMEREEDYLKFSKRTARLDAEMIKQSKRLLELMGVPYIEAPSEGEAQAAFLVKTKKAYAAASEDYDCLLFGADRLVRNLSFSGKKKVPEKPVYMRVRPELIELEETLARLEISQDQLIALAMLSGTDFNQKGIPGIGPKKALKLVKKHGNDFEALFEKASWDSHFDFSWKEVFMVIKEMECRPIDEIRFSKIDGKGVVEFLCTEFEFTRERIEKKINELLKKSSEQAQPGLKRWIK